MRTTSTSPHPASQSSDDPLALFDAEPPGAKLGPSESGASPVAVSTRETLSLEAALATGTPIHWLEAVAIVEQLCSCLIADDGREFGVPDLAQVHLHHSGSVLAQTEPPSAQPAQGDLSANRVGRILHTLASAGPMPAPLRLIVTKWIETTEDHSIAEIRRDLSHFVRPDSAALIKAVFDRCDAALTGTRSAALPRYDHQRPKTSPVEPSPRPTSVPPMQASPTGAMRATSAASSGVVFAPVPFRPATQASGSNLPTTTVPGLKVILHGVAVPDIVRRVPPATVAKVAGIAAGAVALVAGALALISSPGASQASVAQTASNVPVSIPFGDSIELPEDGQQITEGTRPPTRLTSTAAAARITGRPLSTAAPNRLAPAPARLAAAPNQAVPSRSASAAATGVRVPGAPTQPPGAAAPAAAPRAATPAAPVRAGLGGRVFTPSDSEVSPPIMVYPQVRPGTIGGPESDFNTMEIVISERGLVEQVRLLSTPRRMTDMMLLSGAKTWRFEPATMNGSAVRYRMEITWPTTR
jgi:hypothetical protein